MIGKWLSTIFATNLEAKKTLKKFVGAIYFTYGLKRGGAISSLAKLIQEDILENNALEPDRGV